ncbi:MAG TPA: hypothetical protein VGB77_19580 [Abditibacteriaceae bacterium]|jgi:hypothetical protein
MNDELLRFEDLSHYAKTIVIDTSCALEDAAKIECVMRDHIFRAPLDGLSRVQFRRGAREAYELLQAERPLFENHFAQVRRIFEQGHASDQQREESKAA